MFKKFIGTLLIFGCVFSVFAADGYAELFNRTTAKLDKGGLYFHYQNTEKLPEQINSLLDFIVMSVPENDPVKQLAARNIVGFLKTVDFSELQAVGSSGKKLADDLYSTKAFISVKKNANGLLFAGAGNENQAMFNVGSELPANTLFATAFLLDGENVYSKCEEKFAASADFRSLVSMFQQMSGIGLKEFAANCSGKFFIGFFKGNAVGEVDFLAVIPDRMNVLKNMASLYLGKPQGKKQKGPAVFEVPSPTPKIKGNIKLVFDKNTLTVCNNVNVFANSSAGKLSSVNPRVFGSFKNAQGIAFSVCNFNPADFIAGAVPAVYQASSFISREKNGFYLEELSNFNLCDWRNYAFLGNLLKELNDFDDLDDADDTDDDKFSE